VAIDEIESDADNRRAKAVIELARIAASGDKMRRGGADHVGVEFELRNSFMFSSINPPPLAPQDRSRLAMLNLRPHNAATMFGVPDGVETFGPQLLRQLLGAWSRFPATLKAYDQALRPYGFDSRAVDTYGTLLAIANLMLGDEALEAAGVPIGDLSMVGRMISEATAAERAERQENWVMCLEHLLASTIDNWKTGEKPSVGSVLSWLELGETVSSDQGDPLSADGEHRARRQLAAAGLGFRRTTDADGRTRVLLAVPSSGPALSKIFAGTVWGAGVWASALKQAPPEVVVERGYFVKIDRLSARCLMVDLAAYDRATGGR
jgi:hypothetical protein